MLKSSLLFEGATRFISSSAWVISEKGIRKKLRNVPVRNVCEEVFLQLHAVQLKRNFSIYFFLKISKNVQKKPKTFRKIINRACFNEYFYRFILKIDKTYLQISFKSIFFKML